MGQLYRQKELSILMVLQFLLLQLPHLDGQLPETEVNILNRIVASGGNSYKVLQSSVWFSADSCDNTTSSSLGKDYILCNCDESKSPKICHVTSIDFSGMGLSGLIPSDIGSLSSLEHMDLGQNNLEGPIPHSLGNLSSLQYLILDSNFLNGSIPPFLGNLMSLEALSLWDNCFTGRVPDELGNLTRLDALYLDENFLSRELPHTLGKLKGLQYLELSSNDFTGQLPASFGDLNLTTFAACGTNLSGTIPEYIGKWKGLRTLCLSGRNLHGSIPKGISALENLRALWITDLAGEGFLFPDLSHMKSLNSLSLRNCSIAGVIPPYLSENMTNLFYLDLSFNKLYGDIPNFRNGLQYLYLTENMLNGSLPISILNSSNITIDLSRNRLQVKFKFSLDDSRNVSLLACCSRNETYADPKWLDSIFNCSEKDAKNTHLFINCGGERMKLDGDEYEPDLHRSGTSDFLSPNRNWAYISTGDYDALDFGSPEWIGNRTCDQPEEALYATARVSPTSLKYYGLCLQNGNYTVVLHFAETASHRQGNIRKRFFDVWLQEKRMLEYFNIDRETNGSNQETRQKFSQVAVSDHLLKIHLYWPTKGLTQPFGPLISAIQVTPEFNVEPHKKVSTLVKASIGVGSTIVLVLITLVTLWKFGFLGRKEDEFKYLELFPGGIFSFHQIKSATQNFSPTNKIGEGGFGAVYKGLLPNGMAIAVKQLSSRSKQGIHEFVNEVGTISALQHPNLVRLFGCCAEYNQLLLVYEFMENNCLARALFGPAEKRLKLDWPTRQKICLGVAKGMAFLHENSRMKIIHRDIKATNILLDKNLNAKISDFGLAKLYEGEDTQIVTKIAGTLGYMAPEYATRGHLTSKADVYSFGVLTLEIVSGRSNASYNREDEEYVYLLDSAYILQKKGCLLELVDPMLKTDFCAEAVARMLNVAMSCTNPSPTLRPSMSAVVSILEGETMADPTVFHPLFPEDNDEQYRKVDPSASEWHTTMTSMEGTSSIEMPTVSREETETISVESRTTFNASTTTPLGAHTI